MGVESAIDIENLKIKWVWYDWNGTFLKLEFSLVERPSHFLQSSLTHYKNNETACAWPGW